MYKAKLEGQCICEVTENVHIKESGEEGEKKKKTGLRASERMVNCRTKC